MPLRLVALSGATRSVACVNTGIAVVAAIAALISALFVLVQTRAMKAQTTLQREIRESAAQPYVWADVRLQSTNGWNLEFVVGNSGPTVATVVCVTVTPPFPNEHESEFIDAMHAKLASGIASLAPGRTLYWTIGPSPQLVNRAGSLAHTVAIDCQGPFGAVERVEYVIDMSSFPESVAHHAGTMNQIVQAIEKLAKAMPDQRKPFRVESLDALE